MLNNHLSTLENKLQIKINNSKIFVEALTHRSYLNESVQKVRSNERLEFLGDAVLELLVSKYLFLSYPNYPEGKLTNLRSAVVNTKSLATVATNLNLGLLLRLSKGEEGSGGRSNNSLLADLFEALLGALYLDQGITKVEAVLEKYLFPQLLEVIKSGSYNDFKSILQEKLQERYRVTPIYKVVKEEGPDHRKTFYCAVLMGTKRLGEGSGKNKQEAEQAAANSALEALEVK